MQTSTDRSVRRLRARRAMGWFRNLELYRFHPFRAVAFPVRRDAKRSAFFCREDALRFPSRLTGRQDNVLRRPGFDTNPRAPRIRRVPTTMTMPNRNTSRPRVEPLEPRALFSLPPGFTD